MQRFSSTCVTLICHALLLAACADQPALLNSERIEARFGNYSVTVLAQDDRWRISSLESRDRGVTTTRTLAIVRFADPVPDELLDSHRQILAGASLGATLRNAGWQLRKTNADIGSYVLTDCQQVIAERMRIPQNATLALHVYRIDALRNGQVLPYATIAELHHPHYLQEADLQRIYGRAIANSDRAEMLAGLDVLALTGVDCLVRQANGPTLNNKWSTP